MKTALRSGLVLLGVALLVVLVTTQSASAHERRQVGKYTFVVGFLEEPAYANLKNGLDLTICTGKACTYTVKDGQRVVSNPAMDAEKTLKADVSTGSSAPLALALEPRYNNPGKYAAYFMPSKSGAYTFHITGTLNGEQVDEKFTSSPDGFSEVDAIDVYPAASANTQPTQNTNNAALLTQVQEAKNSAASATTFGVAGLVVGILGLAAAGFALARKPKVAASTTGEASAQKSTVDSLRG
jgi:hypothetical protein